MEKSIIEISRDFFEELVKPILEREFPEETAQTAEPAGDSAVETTQPTH